MKVIVKFDDFDALFHRERGGACRKLKIVNLISFCLKCKMTWGVMGEWLQKYHQPEKLAIMRRMLASNRHLFWNHGWTHSEREFKYLDFETAKNHLQRTNDALREYLGVECETFGAPWNSYNEKTRLALESVSGIKHWFFGENEYQGHNFPFDFKLETTNFHPDFRALKNHLAKIDIANTDVLVLQAHPPYWSSVKDFWNFLLSVLYLKFKGFQFAFPNEVC